MIKMKIKVEGLDKLRSNFSKSPETVHKYLKAAVFNSMLEVENQAVDRNFQFKTPRSRRTGYLQRSFSFGRYIHPSGLMGTIGPTAVYAPFVYYGTGRMKANKYMDRISKASEEKVNKHFNDAVGIIIDKLAKI
jgi:hypothetical protein